MTKKELSFILASFVTWRTVLFIVAALALFLLPRFGGRFPYAERVLEITGLPNWIWGFGNFDGVHYLRIAQDGYRAQYSQAFFPLFPITIRLLATLFPKLSGLDTNIYTDPAFFYSGLLLSNGFFAASLVMFYKLLKLDFGEKVTRLSLIFLLAIPTAFYFGAIYTESLFLLLAVSAFYFLRKEKYLWSAVLIGLAAATRLIGVVLIVVYLIEVVEKRKWKYLSYTPLMFAGIVGYMAFLKLAFNNAVYFLTSQPVFGADRLVGGVVLLPQVFFRYLKIFWTTPVLSQPFFNAGLEFTFTLVSLGLILALFKKARFSYWFFSITSLTLPTLTGTLSSMPRYALLSLFVLIPYLVIRLGKYYWLVIVALSIVGCILLTLFVRGYWVA